MGRTRSTSFELKGLLLDILVLILSWVYVLLAPYTKVEESFNLHATHDVLMYGVMPSALPKYDHKIFPGAVPRTFVGSILLGWLTTPPAYLAVLLGLIKRKSDLQVVLRLVLASINSLGLVLMRRAVSKRFGPPTSWLYAILTCSQFHLLFWMSRTIPNMFALTPVNLACFVLYNGTPGLLHPSKRSADIAVTLLVFTAVVFRSEIILLLTPLALQLLVCGHVLPLRLVRVVLMAGVMSIGLTLTTDSYFWDQWPLWPELHSIHYNVYLGKSAEWGTQPSYTYFAVYLPRLLLGAFPLTILGAVLDARIRSLLFAPILFVLLLSALGHKEWRFIIYVVPIMNVAAARGARWLVSRRRGFVFKHVTFACVVCLLALNFLLTSLSTKAAMENYPGGLALAAFNERYARHDHIHIHMSNLAAQTGATLFLHERSPPYLLSIGTTPDASTWTYNKTENLTLSKVADSDFTHLIAESSEIEGSRWSAVDTIRSFRRWVLNEEVVKHLRAGKPWEVPIKEWSRVLIMETAEELWIMERTR